MKGNHSWSHTTRNWCFQGELCTQETFLGLPFSATQTSMLLSHHLTCSLSQPPILESQDVLLSCRAGADVTDFPSPPASGPWAELTSTGTGGISPDLHVQRVPATLFLATDLIWTHHVTLKLQLRGHLKHPQYALSTLFLNVCKKSHYFTSPEKESTVAFGICLHTSSTLFSALWWWWYLLLLPRCTRLCNCLAFWFNQLGEKTCSKFY